MPGKGCERCALGRIKSACRLHQPEVAGAHQIAEVHAWRKPPLKVTCKADDEAEVPFGQFVGRRLGRIRHLVVSALRFTLRHKYLLVRFRKLEWVRKLPGVAAPEGSSSEFGGNCHKSGAVLDFM